MSTYPVAMLCVRITVGLFPHSFAYFCFSFILHTHFWLPVSLCLVWFLFFVPKFSERLKIFSCAKFESLLNFFSANRNRYQRVHMSCNCSYILFSLFALSRCFLSFGILLRAIIYAPPFRKFVKLSMKELFEYRCNLKKTFQLFGQRSVFIKFRSS